MKPGEREGRGKMVDGGKVALGAKTASPMPILVVGCGDDIIPSMTGLTRYCPLKLKSSMMLRFVGVLRFVGEGCASPRLTSAQMGTSAGGGRGVASESVSSRARE